MKISAKDDKETGEKNDLIKKLDGLKQMLNKKGEVLRKLKQVKLYKSKVSMTL
jgi:hypothetical protein